MHVYKGIVDDSAAWAYAYAPPSSPGGLAYTVDKNTITVTGLAAGVDVAFVDITASRSGFASITKRFSVSKSKAGAGGTGTVGDRGAGQYWAIGSSWSDVVADMATPGSNMIGDQVTIADGTVTYTKRWDGDSWEVPGGYLSDSLFVEKGITAAKINTNGLDIRSPGGELILGSGSSLAQQAAVSPNLIPRLSSWPTGSRYNAAIGFSPADPKLVNGEYAYLGSAAGGYVGIETASVGIPQNATYTISFDAYSQNVARDLVVDLYGPNVDTPGLNVTVPTSWKRFTFTESMTHPDAPKARMRMFAPNAGQANAIIIANVKLEIGTKATPWCDNVITKENVTTFIQAAAIGLALIDRASIGNLAALVAYLGNVEIGPGGALRQGQTGYDEGIGAFLGADGNGNPALSLRSASGKYLRINPANDQFEFNGPKLNNPDFGADSRAAWITSSPTDSFTHPRNVVNGYCGTHTAHISNPVNPTYSWSIFDGYPQAQFTLSGTTEPGATVRVTGTGAASGDEVSCTATCVISDGGVTKTISIEIFAYLQ
jgi:hypothetical protein